MAKNGICVKCDAEFKFAHYADLQPDQRITCKYCRFQMRKVDAEAARDARYEAKRQRRYRKWRGRHPSRWVKLWRRINPTAIVIVSGLLTLFLVPGDREDSELVVRIFTLSWFGAAGIVTNYFERLARNCGDRITIYWRAKRYLAACGMGALSLSLTFVAAAWPLKRLNESRS